MERGGIMANGLASLSGRRRIELAAAVVIVVITAAGVMGMILPAWHTHQQAEQGRAKLAEAQAAANKAAGKLEKMRAAYGRAQKAVAKHPLELARMDQLNERLSQVTALAARHHLAVDAIKPGQAQVKTHYVCQPIRVSGTGGFSSAVSFIHQMHKQLPDIAVRSLKLTADPTQPHRGATFEFDLRWYAAGRTGGG